MADALTPCRMISGEPTYRKSADGKDVWRVVLTCTSDPGMDGRPKTSDGVRRMPKDTAIGEGSILVCYAEQRTYIFDEDEQEWAEGPSYGG